MSVFDDLWGLELAGGAYLPQVVSTRAQRTLLFTFLCTELPQTTFEVEESTS